MKNSIIVLSLAIVIIGGPMISCQSQADKEVKANDKVQDAKSNLNDAQSNLQRVKQDTITPYQQFITDTEKKINTYEKEIVALRNRIATENRTEKVKYEKRLAQLEQNNQALKMKFFKYRDQQDDNWSEKKEEFKKDLDALGSSIANFFERD